MCVYNVLVIISFVNTKGGVAKTTSTILLGAALSAYGSVKVFDTDPQGSAEGWAMRAVDSGTPLPFEVLPATAITLQRLGNVREKYVLIDTPPGNPATIAAAVDAADLVIIPTDAAPLDMERTWATFEATSSKPTVLLFTQVNPKTKLFKEVMSIVENEENVAVFENCIPRRQAFKEAANSGSCPRNLGEYVKVAKEIIELEGELYG